MSEQKAITLLAALTFNSPVDEALTQALAALVSATRQEPGCVDYAAHTSATDSKRVLFYERWQDQAALDSHNASAHLAVFRAVVGPRLAAPSDLSFWTRLD